MIDNGAYLKRDELYTVLKRDILSGEYKHGLKIPPEPKLAEKFNVSRDTLRMALKKLEKEGLLIRIRPKGTFVNAPNIHRKVVVALIQSGNDIAEPRNYVIPGMQKAVFEHELEIELCPVEFVEESISTHNRDEIAGFVIFGGRYSGDEPYLKFLKEMNLPVVMAGCHTGDVRRVGFAGLKPDRSEAWMDGIRALKKAGHTRIATLSMENLQGFNDNYEAYRKALRDENIFDDNLIFFTGYNYAGIRAALVKMLEMGNPPTAVMCYSDFFAMLLLKAASELGVRIPEQICVMGFSGYPGARFLNPPLATVELNYFMMGQLAVELISGSDKWFGVKGVAVPEIIVPHKVVIRDSAKIKRVEQLFFN